MFTRKEMNEIDREYFESLHETMYHVTLKSKNTGHIWDIESKMIFGNLRSLVIHHKHKESDPFHVQPRFHPKSISEAQEMIKSHDEWHLNGRSN